MNDLIPNLMLTPYDIALLISCTIGAILGSVANIIMLIINPERAPSPGEYSLLEKNDALLRGMWIFLRVTLGGILGVVFALYFIGTLQESISTLGKLAAFSVFIGYAAPKLWIAQERALMKKVDERIKGILIEQKKDIK